MFVRELFWSYRLFCPVHAQWQNSTRRIQKHNWQYWELPSCHILSPFSFPVTVSAAFLGGWDLLFAHPLNVNICQFVLKFECSPVSWNGFEEKHLLSLNLKTKLKKSQPNNEANKKTHQKTQNKTKHQNPIQPTSKNQQENEIWLTQILLAYNSKYRSEKC